MKIIIIIIIIIVMIIRDGHQAEAVVRRCSVKNLAKFTGKYLYWSFLFFAGPKG